MFVVLCSLNPELGGVNEGCNIFYYISQEQNQTSRNTTKPKWVFSQRRLRSAWASAQSDQSLLCPHEETLGP